MSEGFVAHSSVGVAWAVHSQASEVTDQLLAEVSELAVEHGLSVYDAAYLELALRRQLPLASRDAVLGKAAKDCRLTLLL
jgi:predicted nucleic acid-binding protein